MKKRLQHVRASLRPGEKPGWYRVENRAEVTAEVHIYDEIGAWGVTASDFVRDLASVSASTINVHINSPGGDVWDGIAIHNAIKNHAATMNVRIDGLAASAASFIAMAGDSVVIEPNAQMMIHDALCAIVGNATELRELADMLDRTSDSIAGMYAAKAGGKAGDWRAAMKDETWYNAEEALSAGLADSIAGAEEDDDTDEGDEEKPDDVAAHLPMPVLASVIPIGAELGGHCTSACCQATPVGPVDIESVRAAFDLVSSDAPAPPPLPQRQPYLPPLPAAPEPEPAPEPGPFDMGLFRAAMQIAANDAPTPHDDHQPESPAAFDTVAFLSSLKEAIK